MGSASLQSSHSWSAVDKKIGSSKTQGNTQMTKWYKMNLMISCFFLTFWDFWLKQSQHESNMSQTIYRSQISLFVKRLCFAKEIPNFVMQRLQRLPTTLNTAACVGIVGIQTTGRGTWDSWQLDVWRGTWVSILLPSVMNISLWKMEASTLTTFTTRSTSGSCIPIGNQQIPWCFLQLVQCSGASGAWDCDSGVTVWLLLFEAAMPCDWSSRAARALFMSNESNVWELQREPLESVTSKDFQGSEAKGKPCVPRGLCKKRLQMNSANA